MEKAKQNSLLAQEKVDQNVWELAVQRARQLYEQFDTVIVGFSGGKDSTATLHAVLAAAHEKPEERLPVRVAFYDEEAIPPDTVEYVRRVSQRDDVQLDWYCVPIACGNACSRKDPFWYPWAPEDKHKWVRELPPEAITDLPNGYAGINDVTKREAHHALNGLLIDPTKDGETVMVLGIRAAESLMRYRAVVRREKDNWIFQDGESGRGTIWKAYPIYDWQNDDVWTAPNQFGWDYNTAYDKQEMHGVAVSKQRMGPPWGQEPIRGLHIWKECWPELWDKMVYRVPGCATAARYALTELYAYGQYPTKPDGITWPEYIQELLAKRDKKEAIVLAKRITTYIKAHNNKVSTPIPESAYHPDTGISWDYLAMLAVRGDRMERKDPTARRISQSKEEAFQKQLDKYNADINKVRAENRIKEII